MPSAPAGGRPQAPRPGRESRARADRA
jgi:hypothetical protein